MRSLLQQLLFFIKILAVFREKDGALFSRGGGDIVQVTYRNGRKERCVQAPSNALLISVFPSSGQILCVTTAMWKNTWHTSFSKAMTDGSLVVYSLLQPRYTRR